MVICVCSAFRILKVPPKLFIFYDNGTLVNASYHKDHGYQMYHRKDNTYVAERKAINVTCFAEGAKPEANITWMIHHGGKVEGVVPQVANRNVEENRTFDTTSVLQLTPNEEEVSVSCNVSLDGTDIEGTINTTFLTFVEPLVFFLLDGTIINADEVYIKEGDTVNITCCAEGSRPSSKLTWEKSYGNIGSPQSERKNKANNKTFDTSISLIISPESVTETISCTSSIVEITVTETVELKIVTYVLQEPSITFNGESQDIIHFNPNDRVTLLCNASKSRPKATLIWNINGRPPPSSTSKVSQSSDLSNLIFQPKHNDLVECISYLDGPNITRIVNVTFEGQDGVGNSAAFDYIRNIIIPLIAVTLTILLVLCIYGVTRRLKASETTNLSASLHMALRDRPVNGNSNISRNLPSIRRSIATNPDENNMEINYDGNKSLTVTNVELGVHLPGEGTFQYWTATASFKNEQGKKIIAKCVSESVQMKEHMTFRTLADNLKAIAVHRNIIEILGVSISSVPYYIYMEYLEYGTLRDFLMRNYQQSRNSQGNIAQTLDERAIHLTGFALDVADGLIYLTDKEYHHPGLSARKILLNNTGTCKLYDFWPRTLATERINQILQKPHPPVAWLSPETIFLRHYSSKSDVWNFGVVVWEIYSLGEIPYSGLTCEEIEQEIRKMRYLDQPLTCPGGIFSMMLASWDTTVDERPDFSEWKQKLVCLLQSARKDLDEKDGTDETGQQSYFTLENNICDYEDDYIEQ